jgi:hypothetical protein
VIGSESLDSEQKVVVGPCQYECKSLGSIKDTRISSLAELQLVTGDYICICIYIYIYIFIYVYACEGYGHSMMKRVYRRMGLSSLRKNSEVGPLAPAGGCCGCGAMLWPGAGEQSRPDRCCAAASCAAANLTNENTQISVQIHSPLSVLRTS